VVAAAESPIGIHMGRKHYKGSSVLIGFEGTASLTIPITEQPQYVLLHDLNGDGTPDLECLYSDKIVLAVSRKAP
jgi:hypothetical protein